MLNCTTCERFDGHKCREFGHLIGMATCPYVVEKKPKTHGDEIRAMTDEEMAAEMTVKGGCPHFCEVPDDEALDCVECWLDYLREEVDHAGTETG